MTVSITAMMAVQVADMKKPSAALVMGVVEGWNSGNVRAETEIPR